MRRVFGCLLLLTTVVAFGAANEASIPSDPDVLVALQQDDPSRAASLAAAHPGEAQAVFVYALLSDVGAGVSIDHELATKSLEQVADRYPLAQKYLAWRHEVGFGGQKPNPTEAAKWRERSASGVEIPKGLDRWIIVDGALVKPHFKRALAWMFEHSDNDRIAQANLADIYLDRWWIEPDLSLHIEWLRRAAEHGEPASANRLAQYYDLGLSVERDPVQALTYRTIAARAGNVAAQFGLAQQYLDGEGVHKSPVEAVKWLRLAAAQGHVQALVKLADKLREGDEGVPVDDVESLRLARSAADLGSTEAEADVAFMLLNGRGAAKDADAARLLFEKAAAKGNSYAARMLGWIAEKGVSGSPDFKLAREWYEKAASAGNDGACSALGLMLLNGLGGEKDPQHAFEWFEKSARRGDAWSQTQVGVMLSDGVGIERDDEEAVTWFQLAAKQGNVDAEANLGYHYLCGTGVPKDFNAAATQLMIAGRERNDMWMQQIFLQLVREAPAEARAAIGKLIRDCVSDPHLLSLSGVLPEMCLNALESKVDGITDSSAAATLIKAMATANRPQSQIALAWHAYLGRGIPYDPKRARAAAVDGAKQDQKTSERTIALIDSVCSEDVAVRENARVTLHDLAEHGDRVAASFVAGRCATGAGEPYNVESAMHYYRLAMPDMSAAEIEKRFIQLAPHPIPPSAEKLAALRAEHVSKFEENHPPIILYQTVPTYPIELRSAEVAGEAEIAFVVDDTGLPKAIRIVRATHPLFGIAATEAVGTWRFLPAQAHYKSVSTNMRVPLEFSVSKSP